MNPWHRFPLIRLLIPLIAGIIAGDFFSTGNPLYILLPLLLFLTLVLKYFLPGKHSSYSLRWFSGACVMVVAFLLACQHKFNRNDKIHSTYFGRFGTAQHMYYGRIAEPVVQKNKITRLVLAVEGIKVNRIWHHVSGKALIYVKKDTRSEQLFYGDRMLFLAEFREPRSGEFPFSFNQKHYLENQNIFYIAYLGYRNWKSIPNRNSKDIFRFTLLLRSRLLMIFRDNQVLGREFAVAAALLLGYVDEIDPGLIKDYSATGAMHILSVSGMHVGIIFLVLDKLLVVLKKTRNGTFYKTIIIVLVIWFYAMLTGLSPAVLRAAVMISLVAIGKSMKRQPDLLNILAASFIILLLWEPALLMNVGFQLSYLAVVGIIVLYKPIYDLYVTSKWLPDKIWSIVAVSIAAQLITTPLSLYYFHQFPNYFLITNIIVVPLSTLVIYFGIILLFLGSVPVVSYFLAKTLVFLISLLNNSIHLIEKLPCSVTRGIYFSGIETAGLFILIISFLLYLFYKEKKYLFSFLICLISLAGSCLVKEVLRNQSDRFIVYGFKDLPAFDFVSAKESILVLPAKDQGRTDDPVFSENLQQTWTAFGVSKHLRLSLFMDRTPSQKFTYQGRFYKKGNFIQFRDKRIGFISRGLPDQIKRKIHIDYLVITGNPKLTMEQLNKIFTPDEIIIDPSNSNGKAKVWMGKAAGLRIKCHSINVSGAVMIDY